jgi:hypothetical protein
MKEMKTYYYIAYRKPRNRSKVYAGDGIWEARNKTIARKEISESRHVPLNLIKLEDRTSEYQIDLAAGIVK